jgi:hypothetical protein
MQWKRWLLGWIRLPSRLCTSMGGYNLETLHGTYENASVEQHYQLIGTSEAIFHNE